MKITLRNNKLKLFVVVFSLIALYAIIDAMPKHRSLPKKMYSVTMIPSSNNKSVASMKAKP